ncbi:MAG: alpha/beta fold hydrolase [Candidatus Omnitrophica bacterium]|nr:alpha/beta fold hydrolase [Candidatus Omnitrophota bacterium]
MRKIYLALIIFICLSIILFVAAFFYIDTHRHTTFLYNIYKNGRPFATVEVDKYNTEDSIVYRSTTSTPFYSTSDIHKRKISVEKKGLKVRDYNKKHLGEGVSMDIHIRRVDSSINFLAVGHSNFAYANRLRVNNDFVIFEKDAILSYFNLVDKYDFKKGGVQSMPALMHTYTFLPPYKSDIRLKLINEELITLGNKRVKALHFSVKPPNEKEIKLWINRWTHMPLLIKAPQEDFEFVWSESLNEIYAQRYTVENELYADREIAFKNKDIVLSGTLSTPKTEGPHPAIVLVWGPGPVDRNALGIFTDMADRLAQHGISVLRFDKRGVSKSGGNFARFTDADLIDDINKAVEFLAQQDDIDKKRIAILGYSEGGYHATAVAADNPGISACIILAGIESLHLPDTDLEMMWSFDKSALKWDVEYLKDITKTARDTSAILKGGKDWTILLQKRVYLKKCRMDIERKPFDIIRRLKIPVLILRGKKDTVIPQEHINVLEETLKQGGNEDYGIKYFNKLNHFFGKKMEDGIHRTYISLDNEVTDAIIEWLDKKLVTPPPIEIEPIEIDTTEIDTIEENVKDPIITEKEVL